MPIANFRRALFCGVLASTILLTGCGGSNNSGFVVTTGHSAVANTPTDDPEVPDLPVNPPDAPVANPDTFVSLGNGTLNQSAENGLLKNDEINGGTVGAFQGATNSGGLVNVASDGSFTYSPPQNFLGTDRFEYILSNETGSSTAGAVVVVSSRGFFVDTAAAANGDGSEESPFDNLIDAFNAAQYGDTVFVFAPSVISGTINLPRGVNLIGEGAGLIAAQTIVSPGTAPTLEGPVVMVSDSVVSGFTIGGGSQGVVSDNAHNVTVRGNEFQASTNEHVRVEDPFGPVAIEGNTFRDPSLGQDAVNVFYTSGNQTVTVELNDNIFTSDGSRALGNGIHITTPTSQVHTYNIRRNTFTGASSSTSYANAIFLEAQSASSDDVNITDNTVSRMQTNGISLLARNGGQLLADVYNNSVSECGENNILLRGESGAEGTVNAFGNIVSRAGGDGVRLDFTGGSVMRYVVSGNSISGSADDGVLIDRLTGGAGTALIQGNTFADNAGNGVEGSLINGSSFDPQEVGLRDNTFTGSGGDDVRFNLSQGSFTACFDISNNIFSSNLSLTQIHSVIVNVERLDEGLDTINSFLSGAPTVTGPNVSSSADCSID